MVLRTSQNSNLYPFLFCLSLGFLFPLQIYSESLPSYAEVYSEFLKGNYKTSSKFAKQYITSSGFQVPDERYFILYATGEEELSELDHIFGKSYATKKERTPQFFNSIFLILERAIVLEELSIGKKWGKIYEERGKLSKKYDEGLYLYGGILKLDKKEEEAKLVLEKAIQSTDDKALREKMISLLKTVN